METTKRSAIAREQEEVKVRGWTQQGDCPVNTVMTYRCNYKFMDDKILR